MIGERVITPPSTGAVACSQFDADAVVIDAKISALAVAAG